MYCLRFALPLHRKGGGEASLIYNHLTQATIMPDISHYFPITDPTLIFFVVLIIILFAPIIMGKLRIPHIIGMVLAGIVVGKYGLNILVRDESFTLFGKVGLYYIMFLAALEMDMENIRRNKKRMLFFGLLTFALPFLLTYAACLLILGYTYQASLLLGCLMASNTLIAYPIVCRYGLQRRTSVSLSVGASMLSLFLALVFLAAIVGAVSGRADVWFWLVFALKIVLFCVGMVWLIPKLSRWFLRRYSDAVMQFIFVMGVLFMSAALSEMIGLEGIFGAFFAGLVLSRYIPRLSPLMNRIEFIGNALFIPYFLIGVGMLIDVRLLFAGGHVLWVMVAVTLFGTLGKALAGYISCLKFRMPWVSGHLMFGLTSAHAAGAIAMVMVGMTLTLPGGQPLVDSDMLNAVVLMILFTCIISSVVTEQSARRMILLDKINAPEPTATTDDERILLPVKYSDRAERLINLAMLMRNEKLGRGLVVLNVVYDDTNASYHQKQGRQLLEHLTEVASSADVNIQTQVRIAANIANGIKHAFKEFDASEIIMGLHQNENVSKAFWGEFTQSLYNGLNRQIILARFIQPLNTLRRIQVAVPSKAQFEPGFYRWLERLARLSGNLECRIVFHGRGDTLGLIAEYMRNIHSDVRAEYLEMTHWNELPALAATIAADHLFVVVTARKGTVSYKVALERLPDELKRHFQGKNLMIIFPDQYGDAMDTMTFAEPQHQEERSAYNLLREWLRKKSKQLKI